MDVTVTSTGGETQSRTSATEDTTREAIGYTQKREKERGISLVAQVRNLGRIPDRGKLEWYFVAKPLQSKEHDYIFDSGNKDITVGAASFENFPLKSTELKSTVEKQLHAGPDVATSSSVKKSGSTLGGWIVRLMIDGKPYQIRASSPTLEAIARNDNQLAAYPRKPK